MVKDPMKLEWFLLGLPWTHSSDADMAILAGSNDPHIGIFIADFQNVIEDDIEQEESDDLARSLAAHIVELHNRSLFGDQSS